MPMFRYKTFPIEGFAENFLTLCNKLGEEGYKIDSESSRFQTFLVHGTTCVSCGKEGKYFALEEQVGKKDLPSKKGHFNLYGENDLLFTSDHILPKFWGGSDEVSNRQCMCSTCNSKKGSHLPIGTPEEEKVRILYLLAKVRNELGGGQNPDSLRKILSLQNELIARLIEVLL